MKFCNSSVLCILFIMFNFIIISSAHNISNSNNSLIHNNTISNNSEIKDPADDYKHIHSRKCFHFKNNYQKNYFGSFSQRKSNLAYSRDIPFESLRIHFDYSLTLPHEEKLIRELIMPPVKQFFENTISVRRLIGKLRLPKSLKSCQNVPIPSFLYKQGVEADLVILVSTYRGIKKFNYEKYLENLKNNSTSKYHSDKNNYKSQKYNNNNNPNPNNYLNDFLKYFFQTRRYRKNLLLNNNTTKTRDYVSSYKDKNAENQNETKSKPKVLPWEINESPSEFVGWSGTCLQDLYTLRPIAGVMQYVADINPTPRAIEEAIWTTLHEITHVLAMDYDLMGDFIDSDFNRKGYAEIIKIKTKLVGLADLIEERQEAINDYFAFANFKDLNTKNSSENNLNEVHKNSSFTANNNKTKMNKNRKFSLRRDLDLERKISEFDKMVFKQVELNNRIEDVFDSENKSGLQDEEHSNFNSFTFNNIEHEEKKKSSSEETNNDYLIKKPKESEKTEEESNKIEFNIKFNKPKKLRLKNYRLFKEAIIKNYEDKQIKKQTTKESKNKVNKDKGENILAGNFSDSTIEFNNGINRVFQRNVMKMAESKAESKSTLIFPEDKFYLNFSTTQNNSFDDHSNNITKNSKSFNKTNHNQTDNEGLLSDFPLNMPESAFNELFLTLEKLLKLKKIRMHTQENFEEVKIPKNFNLTVLLMYIENFSENTKIFVKTPKVVEAGRKHFACNSLDGVELEHFGGIESAYSHWSKRILNTEYMIADSYGENYISDFTLALLEDSGWYKVDYSKSELIPWGKGKGCEFLNEQCIRRKPAISPLSNLIQGSDETNHKENSVKSLYNIYNSSPLFPDPTGENSNVTYNNTINNVEKNINNTNHSYLKVNHVTNTISEARFNQEFCTSVNEEECSITHVFRALCGVNRYTQEVPQQYQYFDDPKIAGVNEFGDYCPYPVEWFDPLQMKPVGSCKNGIQLRPGLGEKICENCRCFISSLVSESTYEKESKSKVKKYRNLDENRASCYETRCKITENNMLRLIVFVEDNEIKCPRKGGILTIEGYKGFIHCPKADDVCFGTIDPRIDYSVTSAYSLFSNISEKLLNILYNFIFSFFDNIDNN